MREWFEGGAADGFNVMCPVLPGDLTTFAEHVMPELAEGDLISAHEVCAR
jgi:alkanesulfonate monooxygenase SsuD/methylene tetrahydromethanopterin reductase-like flavin-dependent oxidoreductase (luciferase family)